nr:hypothetical protein CFP56_37297 [Quercus suber]
MHTLVRTLLQLITVYQSASTSHQEGILSPSVQADIDVLNTSGKLLSCCSRANLSFKLALLTQRPDAEDREIAAVCGHDELSSTSTFERLLNAQTGGNSGNSARACHIMSDRHCPVLFEIKSSYNQSMSSSQKPPQVMLSVALYMALLATSSLTPSVCAGAVCVPSGSLLPVSSPVLSQTFTLSARDGSGNSLPVVSSAEPLPGTFFQPLSLGTNTTSISDAIVPKFILSAGRAFSGGRVLSMKATPLLISVPLYVAADSAAVITNLGAVNATCDGVEQVLLRFQNLLNLPLAGGILNGTFAPGVGLNSPILEPLLGLGEFCSLPNHQAACRWLHAFYKYRVWKAHATKRIVGNDRSSGYLIVLSQKHRAIADISRNSNSIYFVVPARIPNRSSCLLPVPGDGLRFVNSANMYMIDVCRSGAHWDGPPGQNRADVSDARHCRHGTTIKILLNLSYRSAALGHDWDFEDQRAYKHTVVILRLRTFRTL